MSFFRNTFLLHTFTVFYVVQYSIGDYNLKTNQSPDVFLRSEDMDIRSNFVQNGTHPNIRSSSLFISNFERRTAATRSRKGKSAFGAQQNSSHQFHRRRGRGQRQRMNKNALRLLSGLPDNVEGGGAFPPLFNIAPQTKVTVNATCGQSGREEYCKLVDAYPHKAWATQCGICNRHSLDKHHPIEAVLDSSSGWWQSPTLRNGHQFEYVTITLDLKQTFEVFFIMLKAAISPRPASWILERSLDNITFTSWQYFGMSDADCRRRYGLPGQTGKYIFTSDTEVICTTQFSKPVPLENGEIHVSLLKNRPGAMEQSPNLLEFITARYIRIRLQGMHSTVNADNSVDWLLDAASLEKRSFYSLKQIRISGRMACHGHANRTTDILNGEAHLECLCLHNTCGANCHHCCPLYNDGPFQNGTFYHENSCKKCQCHGHAESCKYVELLGGICENCMNSTAGSNCESCLPGFFRPPELPVEEPCQRCDCNPIGSFGDCDAQTGDCACKEGFTGDRCDLCVSGHFGSGCVKCRCDDRGTVLGGECQEQCECKSNVEGESCDKCKPGYFGLRFENAEGCTKCFCSGVGVTCKSATIETTTFETLDGWKMTDISRTLLAYPMLDNDTGNLVFGMYDLPDVEAVYWLAPRSYCGNKLTSYGSRFTLKVSWIVIRGDTSGKPTAGPSLILVGRNGLKIAFGDEEYKTSKAVIDVTLTETGWYHIPKSLKDIVARSRRTEYRGDPVTRSQFMSVLRDIETVMVRGTFHTDQGESVLERATLYSGSSYDADSEVGLVEECTCPLGYAGYSCENCDFGYVRIYENKSSHEVIAKCVPCPCNGHADCDPATKTCGDCHHNTFGERCERCKVGFYGNAVRGTPNDCTRCACPLADDSNNFSLSCQLKQFSLDRNLFDEENFFCTQCQKGYTGDHCEMCDDGFYGNPTIPGSKCFPCPCDGGPCDIFTGECITCQGNAEGWRCERCKSGFFGDPSIGCHPCDCYDEGSSSQECDTVSGQCLCKERFAGEKCDQCEIGYADIDLKCLPCECNANGSVDAFCEPRSGQCSCKKGVQGVRCDECQDEFFGLTGDGCEECHCTPLGSVTLRCDRFSGQCICKSNVTGRRCEKCQPGHWNLTSNTGCWDCQCDPFGSRSKDCNPWTGQCDCKIGVSGRRCDMCHEGFYGFSSDGCKRCDLCPSEGHICESNTGRCICPPNSKGPDCIQCYPGTWGWKPRIGCDRCDCDTSGSIGQSCDTFTGQCICREGYAGRRCDACAVGYYDYPNCKRCNCNPDGSQERHEELIECDSFGQCPCKELVSGIKCDTCVANSFGLSKDNHLGCTRCFCFGRSQECKQSGLTWGHIQMPGARNLSVQYIHIPSIPQRDYEFVVAIQMEGARSYHEDAEISNINGLNLIPRSTGNVSIGAYTAFYYPLYFQLPPQFYGDMTKSYGGFLRFSLLTAGCSSQLEKAVLTKYPVAQIHSHNKLILDYYESFTREVSMNDTYAVPLRESFWKYHQTGHDINRGVFMTALQNIRHIFLRGTTWSDFTEVVLYNVQMDSAIYLSGPTQNRALGVEECRCPHQYDSYSCQDPGKGFYRWRNHTEEETLFMEDLIGRSIPCDCSGRSTKCDRETGFCLNCADNTGGNHCDECAEGYYGDPSFGGCKACPCPETSRNFAKGCTVWSGQVSCICKPGYVGQLCERCAPGYFGFLEKINELCRPCECSSDGSLSEECDELTGQCICKAGVKGRKCDICETERHYLEDNICKLCDNCSQILMDYAESISHQLRRGVAHMDLSGIPAPWLKLQEYEKKSTDIEKRLESFLDAKDQILIFDGNGVDKLLSFSENNMYLWRKHEGIAVKRNFASGTLENDTSNALTRVRNIYNAIQDTILALDYYGSHNHHITLPTALEEARHHVDEIRAHEQTSIDMRDAWHCAFGLYYFFGNASDAVQDQQVAIEILLRDLNSTNRRISDIQQYADKTFELFSATDDILEHVRNIKSYLVEDIGEIHELKDTIFHLLNHNYVSQADTLLVMIENGFDDIERNVESIKNLRGLLEDTFPESDDHRKEIRQNWVAKAWRHANRLLDASKKYARQFQTTKDGARVALLASSAHKNISEAIEAAKEATKEAKASVVTAQAKLYPTSEDSVVYRADVSFGKSKLIKKDAMKEMQKIDGLQLALKQQQDKVESIKSIIWQAGLKNNNISLSLETINNEQSMNKVFESVDLATKISDQMRIESRKAVDIKSDIYKLRQKFAGLEPEWDTQLGLAEENISQTLSNIRMANSSLNNIEVHAQRSDREFQVWNNSVSKQLQGLKDKIARARHAAQGIKVSLVSQKEKCIRSYFPVSYGLSTSNTIKFSFALNSKNGNSPLLFIQGLDRRFIALELVKKKVRLIWNLGGKTGIVTHPLEIQTKELTLDDGWYYIEANRTLNIGSLIVRRMTNNGVLSYSNHVSGLTNAGFTRFFTTSATRVWLGGVPHDMRTKELLQTHGLNVVVHQVYIDNKPMGLWNFAHSEGNCGGAMIGPQETITNSNSRHFNGAGYAEMKKTRRQNKKFLFYLQMTFKTLDENALLFLAVDNKNNRSVSVTLSAGRIVFRIDYGDESKLEINTTKKYNTGKWVSIEAAREFVQKRGTENGSLKVNTEEPLTGSPTRPITAQMLPDLVGATYYLGGVPPGFRSGTSKAPGADNPFLGCMMDVQINGETYDPLEGSSYFGVEPSCREVITKAGFYGQGYVELPSQSLRKRANAGFVFRTLQPECLLLLSAYPPQVQEDYDARDLKGNYSVSLLDGRVSVWIDTGRDSVQLLSNVTVNDGEYHVVNILKMGRKIELMVDDELQATKILSATPSAVNMPKDAGGMYFGGAPNFPEYKSLAPTLVGLEGTIRDVVFNNKTVPFSNALSFANVQIGRAGPQMGTNIALVDVLLKTEPIGKSFIASKEGCQRVGSYSYEPNAFKFGDGPNSHSQLNVPVRHFWQKNFAIKFDFRTFYPNGIILIAPGTKEKQKHFVSLLLRDGHLLLIVRGRRREELPLTAKLNDGQWHHVSISCQDRKVTMSVEIGATDQKTSSQMKIPKKISASNMLFIGGLPENNLPLPTEFVMKLEGFKGCIRKMTINNATQDLARPEKHVNIGQCFPKVEKGSYFPGDAYAVYKKNFHVGKYLELELEFRTSELNGVLLSVSEPVGFPALSLEVHNGNVILSCDLGDGNPFRVESIFPSKYAICDNKWHNISALYDFEQIALRIDNHPAIISLAQHRVAGKVHTKSALYIGGLPEIAPSGTLLSRESFKGCIRNVSIRNERKDWVDMDVLHNVLLSECLALN